MWIHRRGQVRGTFRDFEAGKSGGVLDLVLHLVEHVNDRTAVAVWLRATTSGGGGPGRGLAVPSTERRQTMNDPASAEATYRPPAFELLTTARDCRPCSTPSTA